VTATILRPSDEDSADSAPAIVRAVPATLQRWRPDSVLTSWLWTLLVTVLAAVTRFWALGFPDERVFDEVYYATEGQEMLRYGYEDNRDYMFIVHPPLGKWLIGLTSLIFGDNSLGWRVAPAIAGVISVVIVTRLAMRMFRSTPLGVLAGVLLSLDGISLVMSRVSLLDIFLQTFVLAGFAALVVDRDQLRGRLGDLYSAGVDLTAGVPSLGPRPWRLAGGMLLGLACAIKWSGTPFWVGFALLSLLWDRGALKAVGVDSPWLAAMKRSWPGGFFSLGVSAVTAYLLTWIGWFVGENSWNRHWGDEHPGSGLMALLPSGMRGLLDYHNAAYQFHSHLYSPHTYKANPWSWLVLGRPISFYYPTSPQGCGASKLENGQRVADCSREILLIGTPIMYWAILPVLGWLLWHWVTTRDWRAGAIWMAFLAGWVFWLQNTKRTGFLFYMTPLMPFLILGLTMAVGVLLSRAPEDALLVNSPSAAEKPAPPEVDDGKLAEDIRVVGLREWIELRGISPFRLIRIGVVALWLGAVLADFIWMWPVFTGGLLTHHEWDARMWFPSWI
jgi:dolichyl-phosphate-mannose-protein mannosyltransferase